MRRLVPLLALVVAPAMLHGQTHRVRVGLPGYMQPVAVDSLASITDISGSRGATFAAAAQVLAELNVPLDTRDSVSGVVGNSRLQKMRSFAGMAMSRLLSCGSGMTGLNADNWRITLAVFALVDKKTDEKTELRVGLVAGATDVQGASKDPVACGTTGVFESLVADRVKKKVLGL